MNPLRIRPTPLGLLLSAPFRWTAASAIPTCQSRQFSYSPSHFTPSASATASPPSSKNNIPAPIPLVPNVETFLSIIGRNMKQHTVKFPSWEALFTLTSPQLRELGIEPPRDRRYLLRWIQRFREGRYGIGGDFQFVRNGVAELRVQESVDAENPIIVRKFVVNVPVAPAPPAPAEGEAEEGSEAAEATSEAAEADYDLSAPPVRVRGFKVVGAKTVAGPYALPLKQHGGARVTVVEGMWEDKRGHKIDGGERRRAEVQFKRRAAERRAERDR